jgi:CubicO group peptidase (beta-lactamase class C family)
LGESGATGCRHAAHPYSIASINKAITSTGVMMLSERGKLDLDAPLERYLGGIRLAGFMADTREVTARRAMAHSAGLPQYFRTVYAGDEMPPAEQMLGRYGMVVFPPGKYFQYSNVGYRALDVAIANVAGKPYGEFLRDEIFRPLGMKRSSLYIDRSLASETAVRYDYQQRPIPTYQTDHPGSGDVWASAHDLLRFGLFHLGMLLPDQAEILQRENVMAMRQLTSVPEHGWGLGWHLTEDRGHRVVEHGGGQPGVSTQLSLYPDEKLAIVVLSNRSGGQSYEIARKIAAAVLPAQQNTGGAMSNPPAQPDARKLAELHGKWTGKLISYEREEPFVMVFHEDGDIHACIGGRLTSLVNDVSLERDVLRGSFNGMMNTGDTNPYQHTLAMTVRVEEEELAGELMARVPDPPMGLPSFVRLRRSDPAQLDQYVGTYRHGEGDIRTITREADRLYSQRGNGARYELDAFGEDIFVIAGTGSSVLKFRREGGQVVEVLWESNHGESGLAPRIDH